MKVSVLILTKNEEKDLPGCLASVRWSDDIWVFDSYSTDGSALLAKAAGANVIFREFDNWASHQNWACSHIPFKHPWVLYVDADERVTVELSAALAGLEGPTDGTVAYRVRRRDFYEGTWLRHVQASPYFIRLFRPDKIRYERLVNPVSIVDGKIDQLGGYLDHFPFSKGLTHWIARHNSYSLLEAQEILKNETPWSRGLVIRAITEKDFNSRRRAQKTVFSKLPARPILKFLIFYFARGGFLDGGPGFRYAILQSVYEYFIVLKVAELRRQTVG